jgi:hypothetical protein
MNEQVKPEPGPRGWHHFVVDGVEEINLTKFADSPNGASAVPECKSKNIPGHILIIDGPEETRS